MAFVQAIFRPPLRLRTLPDRWVAWLRPLWMISFGLAVLVVLISTLYVFRVSYWVQPTIEQFDLDFEVSTSGELVVGTFPNPDRPPAVPVSAKVVSIDGKPVPADLKIAEFAKRLDEARSKPVKVVLRQPDGKLVELAQTRHALKSTAAESRERNFRIWTRLATGLLACSALLTCGLLLALRRPNDPVAMLLAFAFVGMVATIDPPMQFWLWTDRDYVIDIVGALFFYLLMVGLAAFPDGVFVPRILRWVVPLGIPFTIFVSVPGVNEDLQGILGVVVLIAIMGCQMIRFRREPAGIARQQIKWTGFGFATGLLLILGAVVLAAILGDQSNFTPMMSLAVLMLFSLGMAAIAIGLLIALLRFRLWEADTVITRSAAYAVVTLIVGIVWAASSDLVKLVIVEVIGHESEAGATTVGAIIAAGVFTPTQSVVLGWTRRHFGGPLDQIRDAAKRLKSWGLTEPPAEVATRALAIIDQAVHPMASAIVMDTAMGEELIAARDVKSENDPRLIERLTLEDEESPVGVLLLGRRSDGNRYNKQELEAIREIIPSLAEALRVARGRYSRESAMQQRLEEMAARLAQLEGGAPKPA